MDGPQGRIHGFIAALLVGKIFGLAVARLRLFRALNEIKRAFLQQAREL
jgi:hypothetical protein